MTFEPMQYGNVKNYFKSGTYVIAKTTFGWCAWADHGTAQQVLLSNSKSANTKAGAIADCVAHAAKGN